MSNKQAALYTSLVALGGAFTGVAIRAAVSHFTVPTKEKLSLLQEWRDRKKRMYLEGQTIYHRYGRVKSDLREKAVQQAISSHTAESTF